MGKTGTGVLDDATSTGMGVIKGLALQKATGGKVQPVHVVNWPANTSKIGTDFMTGPGSSGARDVAFGAEAAARTAMLSKSWALPGALGKGAALTGGAGLAALALPIAIGVAGAVNYSRLASEAAGARDKADAANERFDATDVKAVVEASVRTKATRGTKSKKDDMTEEEIQAEVNRRLKNFSTTEEKSGGVVDDWVHGFKKIFGLLDDAAKVQKEAAAELKAGAAENRRAGRPLGDER
jgi:hypothetical protein